MDTNYPQLKFKLDEEFDEWTCREFLTFDPNDMFSNSILRDHPELEAAKGLGGKERKEYFNPYIKNYYAEHQEDLEAAREEAEQDWDKIEKDFYKTTDSLFHLPWPKGNYICSLSIFNCNPRFIEDAEFQAYYKHPEGIKYVSVHEMLHFIFYEYVKTKHSEIYNALDTNEMWKLSEVFNDVILREPEFVNLTDSPDPKVYAQSDEEFGKYTKLWERSKNIDDFFLCLQFNLHR